MTIKRLTYLIVATIVSASCSFQPSKELIRMTVVEKYPEMEIRPYNGYLQYFAECYFRYPESLGEFVFFLEKWKETNSSFAFAERFEGCDLIKYLKERTVYYASYIDSAFYLIPSIDAGSVVIGTPQFWQENPGAYPEIVYRPRFSISGFDSSGEYVFEEYDQLRDRFESVRANYSNRILRPGVWIEPLSREVHDSLVYLNLIFVYDVDDDCFSLSDKVHIPMPDSLFSTKTNIEGATRLELGMKSVPEVCEKYLEDIQIEVKDFLADKNTIKRMMMVIPMYF